MAAVALYIWLSRIQSLEAGLNLSWISWVIVAAVLLWMVLTRYLAKQGCAEIDELDPVIRLPDS